MHRRVRGGKKGWATWGCWSNGTEWRRVLLKQGRGGESAGRTFSSQKYVVAGLDMRQGCGAKRRVVHRESSHLRSYGGNVLSGNQNPRTKGG